jgi:hypothetical protein
MRDFSVDGEINIKTDLKYRYEGMEWIHLAQDRVQWRERLD